MSPLDYIIWLRTKISILSPHIVYSFVFGSVARYSPAPSDCDIMIVTSLSPHSEEWNSARRIKDSLCRSFDTEFDLPLSAIMLTVDEYIEEIPFLIRILNRPLIDICGHDIETPNNLLQRIAKKRAR